MWAKRTIFLLLCLFVAVTAVRGAENDYIIGTGDVLTVTVYDEPDLERTVTVQDDGTIRIPLIRKFKIAGLAVPEAERQLEAALGENFLVDPQVTITVKEYRANLVYVLGAVKTPGLYALTGTSTVLEILSKAGGITEDGSRRILLVRGGVNPSRVRSLLEQNDGGADARALEREGIQPPIEIDGVKLLDEGDTSQDRVLQNGDVLYIPKSKKVYVLGEVRRSGAVPYTEDLTVVKAISLAGGTTEMASNTVQVTRKTDGVEKRFKLKLKTILQDSSQDLKLEPEDVILVKRRLF